MANARDVAQLAGVSVSTVSRALARAGNVSAATQQRVAEAAARLGYQPDPTARGLRMGRTNAIGLVVPDLENPYFASVTKGVQARARAAGYALFVTDSEEDPATEPTLVAEFARRVDGIILASPRTDDETLRGMVHGAPTVLVSRDADGVPSVAVDDADGMTQVLGHLHALGHRRVGVAAGPGNSWSGLRRVAGLRRAAEQLDGVTLVELGSFPPYFSGGFAAADHAVAAEVTAVVAFNDLMALGILDRLRGRGVRVPDDMSVVGFDDVAVATLVSPALTTVHVPRAGLGRRAVDLLVAAIEARGSESPELASPEQSSPEPGGAGQAPSRAAAAARHRLGVEIVIRGSTGVPGEPFRRSPLPGTATSNASSTT
ncbi:LacI family transcriptional regulator [Isoptericola sp. NEAU-Y5]|uniref:LacI family transcriptional regulator n=1 Tax=Isoptericola luteus TaxID=2879484 RepID=A0ABS7ZCS2_9MICO|nr:LacI family DNA-binding transcriptional regulator [Isoptericola sp. NEAU-Y5]MCA5892242.1 LacI family transcriptional regulator [Isoptericola sp. NEAU-Y5]